MNEQLITLAQAAQYVHKSAVTLRKLVNDGRIPAHKSTTKNINLVSLNDVLRHYAVQETLSNPRSTTTLANAHTSNVESLQREQINQLSQQLEREQRLNDQLRNHNESLTSELSKTNAELVAFLNNSPTNLLSRWLKSSPKT